MTITDFILARLGDDEQGARDALRDDPGLGRGWRSEPRKDDGQWSTPAHEMYAERVEGIGITIYDEGGHNAEQAEHIARHDPARVLAECAAKRRIVEWHQNWPVLARTEPELEFSQTGVGDLAARMMQRIAWLTEREYRTRFGDEPPTAPILRMLASVYADHPDYDEAWRI